MSVFGLQAGRYSRLPKSSGNHNKSFEMSTVAQQLRHARERSEEHTSELQSQSNLVCRLLLEKKKTNNNTNGGTSAAEGFVAPQRDLHVIGTLRHAAATRNALTTAEDTCCADADSQHMRSSLT